MRLVRVIEADVQHFCKLVFHIADKCSAGVEGEKRRIVIKALVSTLRAA